jgi:uncharacterized hydrophobic protein (TIGR00271 family)
VHARIEEGATFSFNFNILLFVAAILAGLGLVSNGLATIIASMLVSPLMGPVVGLAYGTTIRDWKLVRQSVKVEIISLAVCILIGVCVGVCTGPTTLSQNWPTNEMKNRGEWSNLFVGLPVAFFSGLGVAVSLLDDQMASLVGVAISASLLPPAVNAGILWIAHFFNDANILQVKPGDSLADYQVNWIALSKQDFRKLGGISLLLTLANIFLIWISSMLMFRMKEVLPIQKKVRSLHDPFVCENAVAH